MREISCTATLDNARGRNKRNMSHDTRPVNDPISSSPGKRQAANGSNRLSACTNDISNVVDTDEAASVLHGPHTLASNAAPRPASPFCIDAPYPGVDAWQDFGWDLGPDSISFLDSIFTHDYNFDMTPDAPGMIANEEDAGDSQSPYEIYGLDPSTLEAAIGAYFDLASLALPILDRDAFQADYTSRRASPSLVYAIACRGCPFIATSQKWAVQQQLASQFRRAWLEARSAAGDKQSIRLDDLEALALMVDFDYETTEDVTASIQSQLGSLFLTHDSMVLMTLQYQILGHASLPTGASAPLHGAAERKNLLFWHVYGKDAFRTLERKVPSRIGDGYIESLEQLPGREDKTYLDAILALAIVARKIHHTFLGRAAGHINVSHHDVINLYRLLTEWRTALPTYLQSYTSGDGSPTTLRGIGRQAQAHPLHQAVLLFLEHNCYMQIEAYASKCGINKPTSLETVMLDHLIEYKTLKMVNEIVESVTWLKSKSVRQNTPTDLVTYPLVDLAPEILRNICAGTSYWLTERGKRLMAQDMSRGASTNTETQDRASHGAGSLTEGIQSFVAGATTLRDVLPAAGSHRDTSQLIERLDEQLSSLKEMIKSGNGS
ncbi:uncharacterized protein E0L32_000760 [Thyridium curvatum]|uniref:Transcription factor domain-containing protein n=1 Tax=Thyridium curvatum TaxID=1093900 RepID=A0A507AY63_9PEZI|nr:uncharacterized protein E0L32_000760 [Thyridium curvatum]TPX12583.1 hypothetical protein E0L32_000760 [Thyridium curvatum]